MKFCWLSVSLNSGSTDKKVKGEQHRFSEVIIPGDTFNISTEHQLKLYEYFFGQKIY